jgi:hypothetical protein
LNLMLHSSSHTRNCNFTEYFQFFLKRDRLFSLHRQWNLVGG